MRHVQIQIYSIDRHAVVSLVMTLSKGSQISTSLATNYVRCQPCSALPRDSEVSINLSINGVSLYVVLVLAKPPASIYVLTKYRQVLQ